MHRAVLLAVVLLGALAPAAVAATPRIVNGQPAGDTEYPAQGFLEVNLGNGLAAACGGTVVAPRKFVTAGHCVADEADQAAAADRVPRVPRRGQPERLRQPRSDRRRHAAPRLRRGRRPADQRCRGADLRRSGRGHPDAADPARRAGAVGTRRHRPDHRLGRHLRGRRRHRTRCARPTCRSAPTSTARPPTARSSSRRRWCAPAPPIRPTTAPTPARATRAARCWSAPTARAPSPASSRGATAATARASRASTRASVRSRSTPGSAVRSTTSTSRSRRAAPKAGEPVAFAATAPAGAAFSWDFDDDGAFDATGPSPTHVYAAAGEFEAVLRITDPEGQPAEQRHELVVAPGAPPPAPIVVTPPPTTAPATRLATILATGRPRVRRGRFTLRIRFAATAPVGHRDDRGLPRQEEDRQRQDAGAPRRLQARQRQAHEDGPAPAAQELEQAPAREGPGPGRPPRPAHQAAHDPALTPGAGPVHALWSGP